jgi:hypothetical protein
MFPVEQLKVSPRAKERVIRTVIPNFVVKAACHKFIMAHAKATRHHRFTRISADVYDSLNSSLRIWMRNLADLGDEVSFRPGEMPQVINTSACKKFITGFHSVSKVSAGSCLKLNSLLCRKMMNLVNGQPRADLPSRFLKRGDTRCRRFQSGKLLSFPLPDAQTSSRARRRIQQSIAIRRWIDRPNDIRLFSSIGFGESHARAGDV